jgi:hypothetical protein
MPYDIPIRRYRCSGSLPAPSSVYAESTENLKIRNGSAATRFIQVSLAQTITVFIKNTGMSPITARLQNSPDGTEAIDDPQEITIFPGETKFLVPYIFSRFLRLVIAGAEGGCARVWFQIQRRCC